MFEIGPCRKLLVHKSSILEAGWTLPTGGGCLFSPPDNIAFLGVQPDRSGYPKLARRRRRHSPFRGPRELRNPLVRNPVGAIDRVRRAGAAEYGKNIFPNDHPALGDFEYAAAQALGNQGVSVRQPLRAADV